MKDDRVSFCVYLFYSLKWDVVDAVIRQIKMLSYG